MGGILTDINCSVGDGLMAVGEVACHSVHGANRLGCNSLLDLVVFGKIAGQRIGEKITNKSPKAIDSVSENALKKNVDEKISNFANLFSSHNYNSNKNLSLSNLKLQMQKNNDKTLGVFRNQELIQQGLELNIQLLKQMQDYKIANKSLIWNDELIQFLELENMLLNSLAVGFCAINRKESRGSHYRFDYLKLDNQNYLAHSICKMLDKSKLEMQFSLKPIRKTSPK